MKTGRYKLSNIFKMSWLNHFFAKEIVNSDDAVYSTDHYWPRALLTKIAHART